MQQLGAKCFGICARRESDQRRHGQREQEHEPDPLDARLPAVVPHDRRPYGRAAHPWARKSNDRVTWAVKGFGELPVL
jgi:hypothetical protein